MVAPGSLDARYERVAGDRARRLEYYVARVRLGFTIDEWRALPWWQRRVYLDGMEEEAERHAERAGGGDAGGPSGGPSVADTLLTGTLDDVAGLGFRTD